MIKARDWDWLCFQRRQLIGCSIVQFSYDDNISRLKDVGVITNVRMSGDFYSLDVDNKNWLIYSFDIILPEISEDLDNIIINDKIFCTKYIILKKTK